MPTPIKNITYLTAAQSQGPVVMHPRLVFLPGWGAAAVRVAPPMWMILRHAAPQGQGALRLKVRRILTMGLAAQIMTPFWRKGSGRPLRGQLWPRTR